MARESFLINPYKRRNSWPKHSAEHKIASSKGWRKRKNKTPGYATIEGGTFPRAAKRSSHKRSLTDVERSFIKGNPFGEEVIVMGANPKKHKKNKRHYAVLAEGNSPKKRKYHKSPSKNPKQHKYGKRRYRRNPATVTDGINFMKPMSLIAPTLAGMAALYANQKIPGMLGMATGIQKYGIKLAVAFGGQMAIKQALKRSDLANVFAIVSLVQVGYEALNEYVLKGLGFSGLPYGYGRTSAISYGAFPEQVAVSGYGAVPSELAQQTYQY